ncbi:MAG: hypothetical protein IPH84_16080 [Bacteroidales bacterium]|nr:hypothetical protein [Bacteroidales bacterium]
MNLLHPVVHIHLVLINMRMSKGTAFNEFEVSIQVGIFSIELNTALKFLSISLFLGSNAGDG